ncbi:MAG: MarR family transcriptional regulator [Deltaproteobacteria bacterium]|nr:MarR family transcriptional regulator [Deltaproteobacteria bacterium]
MKDDDRIIYGLSETQRTLMAHLKERLFAAGLRITAVQAGILFLLIQKDGRSMTELSRLLFTDNSSLTRLVDRLEKAGLLRRLPDPRDRRTLIISITEDGRKQAAAARRIVRSLNEEIKTRMSPEELEVLQRVLGRLKKEYSRNK